MAARNTVPEYKAMRLDNKLGDAAITVILEAAARRIDGLIGLGPTTAVLKDAELWLALYIGTGPDRRIRSLGIPPTSTSYELIDYLELLRLTLGDYYSLLGDLEDPVLKPASISVITATSPY